MSIDVTATQKKHYLASYALRYNKANPKAAPLLPPPGFDPDSDGIGLPAHEFAKRVQRAHHWGVTGQFDVRVMRAILPASAACRIDVMSVAHAELGEHEWPAGSNWGPVSEYLKPLGLGAAPWCAAFVTWVLRHAGYSGPLPSNPAYVPSWVQFGQSHGLMTGRAQSKPGDLWMWQWDTGLDDHIGFADEGVKGQLAYYIDGNVGNYGGQVTDSNRSASLIDHVIDLEKLARLGWK